MKPEIERKYRINPADIPVKLSTLEHITIEQGYLIWNDQGDESRLRKIGKQHMLTIKKGKGVKRMEAEIELSEEQFVSLWPFTEGKRLFKTRYYLVENNHLIEIDIYAGKASGLAIAEVEFNDENSYRSYIPPDWFGSEVSEDESFRNRNLAVE
jgi:adenylate cyclase